VGGAASQLLLEEREMLGGRSGVDIELAAIFNRSWDNARRLGLPESLFVDRDEKIIEDPTIDVVVELVGGLDYAKSLIERALDAGKHVVTANKALLAHHGRELFAYARERGLTIAFEASCGGGIPIIRAITDGLLANRIDALYGIVNGTSNYILTKMVEDGETYPEALDDAKRIGLAEADPTLDVEGIDSAHKIAIMTALAFGTAVDFDSVQVRGIHDLQALDVRIGSELGYVIKLVAAAHRIDPGVSLWVRPAFFSREHPLAWVSGPFNALSVYGNAAGHTLYYGRGAGGRATASAVLADLIAIGLGTFPAVFSATGYWPDTNTDTTQIPAAKTVSRFYVRIIAQDRPGVLAQISKILGDKGISIASLVQHEHEDDSDDSVPVVVTTHRCLQEDLEDAVRMIDELDTTGEASVWIPIVDEHPEHPRLTEE
jgi:homoserine dehydrogenase